MVDSKANAVAAGADSKALGQGKLDLSPSGRRRLAERYVPLAKTLAKPYKAMDRAEADVIDSIAMEALVDASNDFDPEKFPEQKFGNWLKRKVRSRVYGWSEKEALRKKPLREFREDLHSPRAERADPSEREAEVERAEAEAADVLGAMPEECARALHLVHVEGLSKDAAAAKMGVGRLKLIGYLERGVAVARGTRSGLRDGDSAVGAPGEGGR